MEKQTLELWSNPSQLVYRAGEGPALVWLHSLYGVAADAPIIDALAREYSVFAPLTPGFADLSELDSIRDIHDLALHYDDLLDALQLENVILAGHSLGAMIAAEVAAHVPKRVSRLILASPLGLWNDAHPVADIFGVPAAEMPTLLYADPANAPTANGKPDVEQIVALARGMAAVARFLWPIPDRGLSRRLHRITAPTLVIHGAQDRFVPVEYVDEFVARIPDARCEIIPGVGHMLFSESFGTCLNLITRVEVLNDA